MIDLNDALPQRAFTCEPNVCCDCHGRFVYGEPLHALEQTVYQREGVKRWTEYRCRECIEDLSRQMWDEESQGPCPYAPVQRARLIS